MAKVKKQHPNLFLLIIVLIESVLLFGILFFKHTTSSLPSTELNKTSPQNSLQTTIFNQLPTWLPDTQWANATPTTQATSYGILSGSQVTTTITTSQATITSFENQEFLEKLGFVKDTNLFADGPGSSIWGYTKTSKGKKQIVLFSYQTKPTSTQPNQPIQFNCPCQTIVTTFVSNVISHF